MWRSCVHALASNGGLASGSRRDEASFVGVGRGGSLRSASGKPPPPSILLGWLVSGEVAGGGGVEGGEGRTSCCMDAGGSQRSDSHGVPGSRPGRTSLLRPRSAPRRVPPRPRVPVALSRSLFSLSFLFFCWSCLLMHGSILLPCLQLDLKPCQKLGPEG